VRAPALLVVSAVFHYLGPAFAVLLFARVGVFGVAWLRIASAAVVATPFGLVRAAPAFSHPVLLLAGVGVGVSSSAIPVCHPRLPSPSAIPYALDQLAMKQVRRATFAMMLSILPATATVIGLVVLAQRPTFLDVVGVSLVIAAVAVHRTKTEETA
jgi:inner membrane transporter RhtA